MKTRSILALLSLFATLACVDDTQDDGASPSIEENLCAELEAAISAQLSACDTWTAGTPACDEWRLADPTLELEATAVRCLDQVRAYQGFCRTPEPTTVWYPGEECAVLTDAGVLVLER